MTPAPSQAPSPPSPKTTLQVMCARSLRTYASQACTHPSSQPPTHTATTRACTRTHMCAQGVHTHLGMLSGCRAGHQQPRAHAHALVHSAHTHAHTHTLMFLSAEPDTSRVESEEMSKESTGSLWPYSDRKNLRLSAKKTCVGRQGALSVGCVCAASLQCLLENACKGLCKTHNTHNIYTCTHMYTHLDGRIQQRHCQELPIGADLAAQHVVGHAQCAHMREAQLALLCSGSGLR